MNLTLANSIIQKSPTLVQRLLNSGANVNETDEYGYTPLIETAIVNDIELAKLIIEHGADVNQKDIIGGTALHWAVENNNLELSKLLLNHKADPNAYNNSSEPILVKPLLRNQDQLKRLLYGYGASTQFAWDYINLKLLGHRYDLHGQIDIVDADGNFTELSFEGFFLEFSLNLVRHSLERYINNFSAKKMKEFFPIFDVINIALQGAAELIQYQQYQVNINDYRARIDKLLNKPLLIIPVNYQGHAICYINHKDILIKCDRRKKDKILNGITFFKIRNLKNFNNNLIRALIYDRKDPIFVENELAKILNLELKARLMIEPQITGNCSWSNIVATVPALFFLLSNDINDFNNQIIDYHHPAIQIYRHWREWDKQYALTYCIQNFHDANPKRKVSLANALASVLFQRFDARDQRQLDTVKRIIKILREPELAYILNNYIEYYLNQTITPAGENLKKLITESESYL